jgi:sensor histidine kinase YesM
VKEETTDAPVSGIGIRNVKERLSLLYPGRHELHITSEEEVFIVNLKVELVVKNEVLIKRDKPAYA